MTNEKTQPFLASDVSVPNQHAGPATDQDRGPFPREPKNSVTKVAATEVLVPGDSEAGSGDRASDGPRAALVKELELELARIRSEASAARLEARAAELELMLERLRNGEEDASREVASVATARFSNWGEICGKLVGGHQSRTDPDPACTSVESSHTAAVAVPATFRTVQNKKDRNNREHTVNRERTVKANSTSNSTVRPSQPSVKVRTKGETRKGSHSDEPTRLDAGAGIKGVARGGPASVSLRMESPATCSRRRKPAAWIASAIVHLLILLLLAGWTLSSHQPRDQIALAASTLESVSEPMETFELETTDPALDEPDESLTEPELEISPVGEIAVPELDPDAIAGPLSAADFQPVSSISGSLERFTSSSDRSQSKMEFCGVEGGGNHFVYVVDSSGSMGAAFESARAELLRSIALLTPDQRFYVIFFDEQPDYMRLSDPNRDEAGSVFATPENKQRVAQWAMGVAMNRGQAPYEPLRFAVSLRPDVVFLLSDGEFPQRIEDQLLNENRYENLFGESGPLCIVHTISYHSREGEERMRRIAEQNGGQYRHVPKPAGGRR